MNRCKVKTAEQSPQRKSFIEQSMLQELLPRAALLLLSTLSKEDKDVVIFLVLFGYNALLTADASIPVGRSPGKAWKGSSSKAGLRLQVCPSCPFSESLAAFFPLIEEIISKKSSLLNPKHKAGSSCDCFSSYGSFWSRWSASPNRDIMSKILEMAENSPQTSENTSHSKGKRKRKVDRKRELVEKKVEEEEFLESANTELSEKKVEEEQCLGSANIITSSDCSVNNEGPNVHRSKSSMDLRKTSIALEHSSSAREDRPISTPTKNTRGGKERVFRGGNKQKDKLSASSLNVFLGAVGDVQNAAPMVSPRLGHSAGAVAIEIPENLTLDISPSAASGFSIAVSQAKNNSKPHQHHRLGRHKGNQVLPLDCEDKGVVATDKREQEAVIVVDNAHHPISPRVADTGLGGRGFFTRVFPDALGRIALRLWDLISFRFHRRSVEYH